MISSQIGRLWSACPTCGRQPKLCEVGYVRRGAEGGCGLFYYVLICRPYLGLFGTHMATEKKGVSSKDPWYRWKEDLVDEWNALAEGRRLK